MNKNIIKSGLGLEDDFLERKDPFSENNLLVKNIENKSSTYANYEKVNLKITENERKLNDMSNRVTVRTNEKDGNTKIQNLIDTDLNTIFTFNCKEIERFKSISLTIKKKSVS